MNPEQHKKSVGMNVDFTVDNGSFTFTPVDTLGYDYAVIEVHCGNVPANMAALKVKECETVGGAYTDVTGLIVGTSTDIEGAATTIPTAAAGDGALIRFEIDLRANRKRFLDLEATAGNGGGTVTELSAVCHLSRAQHVENGMAARGCTAILRV